jgi:hypothetical protein
LALLQNLCERNLVGHENNVWKMFQRNKTTFIGGEGHCCNLKVDAEQFDPALVHVWTPAFSLCNSVVAAAVDKFYGEIPPTLVEDKVSGLKENLKENPSWPGASAKIGASGCNLDCADVPQLKEIVADAGSSPRMLALKKWAFRCGAQAWANPGLGAFARAETDSIGLKLIEVCKIVGSGIALNDLAGFLETATGSEIMKQSPVVPVKKGELVWVPYGWFAIPVSCHEIRAKDTEDPPSKAEVVETAFMFAFNVWVPQWAKKMESGAWSGVVALNRSHFERNKGKQLWADRSTVFEKFVKAVEKM